MKEEKEAFLKENRHYSKTCSPLTEPPKEEENILMLLRVAREAEDSPVHLPS